MSESSYDPAQDPFRKDDVNEDLELEEEFEDEPRRRSKTARRPTVVFANLVMTGAVFALAGGVGAFVWAKGEFEKPGAFASDTSFTVREGSTLTGVANELEKRGIIQDARLFRLGARLEGEDRGIKTGEFSLAARSSMKEVLNELTDGSPVEYRVTIPEGWTVYQALERIAAHPELTGDMPTEEIAEASLAAETISFARGEKRSVVIEKLQRIQAERLERAWASRSDSAPLDTPNNLMTLASLVEKETSIPRERRDVAAVYANRIRENWHLNADPTVIYGVYGGAGLPPGKSITKSDLADDNLYNTYRMRGMPPGPVAIPGEASLMAAANPSDLQAMFFVADGTGGHIFANTLEEHNANVRKWRRIERGEEPRPERTQLRSAAAAPIPEAPSDESIVSLAATPSAPAATPNGGTQVASTSASASSSASTSAAVAAIANGAAAEATPAGEAAPGTPVPFMRPE